MSRQAEFGQYSGFGPPCFSQKSLGFGPAFEGRSDGPAFQRAEKSLGLRGPGESGFELVQRRFGRTPGGQQHEQRVTPAGVGKASVGEGGHIGQSRQS